MQMSRALALVDIVVDGIIAARVLQEVDFRPFVVRVVGMFAPEPEGAPVAGNRVQVGAGFVIAPLELLLGTNEAEMILTVGCFAHAEYQVALSIEIAVVGVVVSISPIALLTGPDIPIELLAVELIVKHQFPALSQIGRA